MRHTPADGSVIVEVGRNGADAFVSVADGGGGVPRRCYPASSTPASTATLPEHQAAAPGLGLAIARSFVEAHHGRITVRNEDGGACFTVWLPVDPSEGR